jgi:hypothetical protein
MGDVGVLAVVLLGCAVLVLIGAEWPRLSGRLGADARGRRLRARRKRSFTVVEGDSDEFAESVQRDLENLPVLGERDDSTRR